MYLLHSSSEINCNCCLFKRKIFSLQMIQTSKDFQVPQTANDWWQVVKVLEMACNFLSLLWNNGWEADAPVKPRNNWGTYFNSKRIMCVILVSVDTTTDIDYGVHRRISDGVLVHVISTRETTYSCNSHTAYKKYLITEWYWCRKMHLVLQKIF